jgi:hypothetical protein
MSEFEHFEKDKFLFKKGEKCEYLFIVKDGQVGIEL